MMSISDERRQTLAELQEKLKVAFRNPHLLDQALTHRSFATNGEARCNECAEYSADYERMEFLGDAVLGLVIGKHLYDGYPAFDEGELTKRKAIAVSEFTLAQIARELDLGKYIRLARCEEHAGGRARAALLADVLEAVIGAAYLDRGLRSAGALVRRLMRPMLRSIERNEWMQDYKTILQERVQEAYKAAPTYRVIDESGPDHDKTFVVEVRVRRRILGVGTGRSKKAAAQVAARNALESHYLEDLDRAVS